MKALKFLNKFYRGKGAKKSFNVLSLHPYSFTPKLARARRSGCSASSSIPIAAPRSRSGSPSSGWTTGGHDWAIAPFKATEAQQAQYLTQSFNKLIRARGELRLQRIFWHDWQDHPDPDSRLAQPDGPAARGRLPKPSYSAYQAEARR